LPWIWSALWLVLPLSMKGSVICIWLLGLAIIAATILEKPGIPRYQLIRAGLFLLLFLWYAVSLLFDEPALVMKKLIEPKLTLIVLPVLVILAGQLIPKAAVWAARGLYSGLIIAGSHMIILAFIRSLHGFEWHYWMYHEFVKPYAMGAIYFSWYLSAALIYLIFRKQESIVRRYRYSIASFFLLLLLLSASKLFIGVSIPVIIWGILKREVEVKKRRISLAIIGILFLAFSFPFINRLNDLRHTSLKIISQDKYTYDTPFNGLTFRLLQWRFAREILDEKDAWALGTGIGSEQNVLNEHYRNYGVYSGNQDLGDKGYQDYNFHDQFLEILVGTGVPGLILLLLIIAEIIRSSKKLAFPLPVFLILILFFFTESVLERQAGIIFFCLVSFLPLRNDPDNNMSPNYGSSIEHTLT
jgi:O-antigen ligase